MKLISIVLLSVLAFSCQKQMENETSHADSTKPSLSSILNIEEIKSVEVKLAEDLNFGNAESFPYSIKTNEEKIQMTKLSYFLQENQLVRSTEIDNSKGYCEVSVIVSPNTNGSEINFAADIDLLRVALAYGEGKVKNELNYESLVRFQLFLEEKNTIDTTILAMPIKLECHNVKDLSELQNTTSSKFLYTQTQTN